MKKLQHLAKNLKIGSKYKVVLKGRSEIGYLLEVLSIDKSRYFIRLTCLFDDEFHKLGRIINNCMLNYQIDSLKKRWDLYELDDKDLNKIKQDIFIQSL